MPFDTRRINGPESSSDYRKFYTKVKTSQKKLRGSNRQKDDQHRPLGRNFFYSFKTFIEYFYKEKTLFLSGLCRN